MRIFSSYLIPALLLLLFVQAAQAQFSSTQALKLAVVMEKVNRFYVDSINEKEVVEDAIEHLLHELDPHSSYLSKEEQEALSEQLDGEFEGIGVSFNVLEDTIYIVRTISGGPSERVGMQAGDRIIKVGDEYVAGIGITNRGVQERLKGPKGTEVEVSVLRRGEEALLDFTITRDKIPVYSLDASYMVDERIGYVKLARFSQTTVEEFEEAVKQLRREGMKELVLDLSGNGGGWLPVAVELADHFLEGSKEIVKTSGDKVPERKYRARKTGLFEDGKLVVMIDGNSASASEIVSGAVQDWDRGVIVGRRSFGKGLVQQPFYLGDGSLMRLTVARYYTPTGRLIQKSYEKGYEDYAMDLIHRYNRGELGSADSIVFPESQKYQTLKLKRTVYGGGGIMPDYFVPVDTTYYSEYYRKLISRGIFNRFVLQYVDIHRDDMVSKYRDFKNFKKKYACNENILDELIKFAEGEDLTFESDQWETSKVFISLLMKAYLARDLWGMPYFYQIYNESDEVFREAVAILRSAERYSMELAYSDF